MSVKLIYEAPKQCPLIQEIGGYCYCRPNVNSKPRAKKNIPKDKIVLDFADYPDTTDRGYPLEVLVDFGLMSVESTSSREINIYDSSTSIPMKEVSIRPWKNKTIDRVFKIIPWSSGSNLLCDQSEGTGRKPTEPIKLKITFEPELPTMNYAVPFLIMIDEKPIRLECRGASEGPSICFSENVLNFGGQFYNDTSRLWFKMQNNSGCDGQFQFDIDNLRSTFKICPTSGIIPAFTNLTIEVLFQAQKPQAFYKRVYCLLHHQQPQYVDLVGVCVPRPFLTDSPVDFCISTDETKFIPFPNESNDEYFNSDRVWGMHLSRDVVNFGYQNIYGMEGHFPVITEPEYVKITNVLPYDVVLEWYQDPSDIFHITPPTSVIPTRKSAEFGLRFQPNFPDTFYSGMLECFVYPTGHFWSSTQGPPWQCSVNELGLEEEEAASVAIVVTDVARVASSHIPSSRKRKKDKQRLSTGTTATATTAEDDTLSFTGPVAKGGKSKGNKQKRPTRVRPSQSTPGILPSGKQKKGRDGAEEHKLGSRSELHVNISNMESKIPDEIPDERKINLVQGFRSFPLQVTLQHSGGGQKRSLLLEALQLNKSTSHLEVVEIEGNTNLEEENRNRKSLALEGNREVRNMSNAEAEEPENSQVNDFIAPSIKSRLSRPVLDLTLMTEPVELTDEEEEGEVEEEIAVPISTFIVPHVKGNTPQELALPLCISLRATGHTFGQHCLIPNYKIPKKLVMNPTWPENRVSRSFLLKNLSDLPLYYDARVLESDGVFQVKPRIGVIPPDFHQIILVSLTPKMPEPCLYVRNCQLEFNLSDKNIISLRGVAELPTMDVVICYPSSINETEIVCQETIPGCGSDTYMELYNTSRFHYQYNITPLEDLEDHHHLSIFTPTPSEGIIAPYETIRIKWRFVPQTDDAYFIKWKARFNVLRARTEFSGENTYYELPIILAGVGRYCFFEAKPDNLEFEMVEIFSEKEMFFTVTNRSNVFVTADFRIMHEDWLQWYPSSQFHPNIRINPTTVTLSGSESVKVGVVVRPDRTNFQKYYVEYAVELTEVEGSDEIGPGAQHTSGFQKLCDISFIGDHAIFKASDVMMIARHPIWDAQQCWSMFSLDSLNEYLLPSKNTAREGMVPIIPSCSFRFPPAPIGSDPAIVTILLSNNEQLRGFWEIHRLPPKEFTKRTNFNKKQEENTAVYDGSAEENRHMLNLIWTKKLLGESLKAHKGAEMIENGVSGDGVGLGEQYEPLSHPHGHVPKAHDYGRIRHSTSGNDALKDVEFFKIAPMRGELKPRGSQQISFRYSYRVVGSHHSSVLLRIHPAIFIWVELMGTTLKEDEPCIQLIQKDSLQFHPVCLSDLDPPIQMFWLFNGGNVASHFEIDLDPFEKVKVDNYGHEVFECLSPIGVVPPRSWAPVLIRFSPIELLDYEIALRIKSEQKTKGVMLKGAATLTPDISLRPEPDVEAGARRKHILLDPLVPVTISPTSIIFTHFVATGQKLSGVVFLTNLSAKSKISFVWPDVGIEGGGSISFIPESGVIRAKEQVAVKVTVTGGKAATIFSRMIRCSMTDESALARYELLTNVWNAHRNVLVKTMTEDMAECVLCNKFNGKPVKPPTFSRVLSVKVYIGSVFGLLDTVFPIEHKRMPFSDNICQPLGKSGLSLLPFGRQLCREILSDLIWDMVHSPSFRTYIKRMSKKQAPYYYEYKSSEMQSRLAKKGKLKAVKEPLIQFPRQASEDVLEQVIFNMIQEVADDFFPGKTVHEVKPVQPQELIDVKKYRRDLF